MPRDDLIELRAGTAAAWTSANPTLNAGEPGAETDTGRLKVGDGSTAWTSLDYVDTAGLADRVASDDVDTIVVLTQAAYNALSPPDADTLYVIVG